MGKGDVLVVNEWNKRTWENLLCTVCAVLLQTVNIWALCYLMLWEATSRGRELPFSNRQPLLRLHKKNGWLSSLLWWRDSPAPQAPFPSLLQPPAASTSTFMDISAHNLRLITQKPSKCSRSWLFLPFFFFDKTPHIYLYRNNTTVYSIHIVFSLDFTGSDTQLPPLVPSLRTLGLDTHLNHSQHVGEVFVVAAEPLFVLFCLLLGT